MKQPTAFEQGILNVVLVELRRAMKSKKQLTITIDPFMFGQGCHVGAWPNAAGRTYEIDALGKRRRG